MTQDRDLERLLDTWLSDGPTIVADRVIDDVAARIGVQPQRRAWLFPGRTTVTTQIKVVAALAAAVVVAIVGYNLLPGPSGPGSYTTTPSPSVRPSTSPSVQPSPSPNTSPVALRNGTLEAGRYRMLPFSESIVADIPAGWQGFPDVPALINPGGDNSDGALIGFTKANSLFSDPCHWDVDGTGSRDQQGDVEVGPKVGDLVNALRANKKYTSSTPSPITIGGFEGSQLELQLPGEAVLSKCDTEPGQPTEPRYIVLETGFYAQGPGNRWRLFIVDVDGARLITMISYFDRTPQAAVAAAQAIVESFEITP